MAVSKVVVVDGNNLIVRIDRGVAGRGITDVEPIEIDNALYLEFTFSDGTTETVGPVGVIQYVGTAPIVVAGANISLSTVPVNLGGTGATTASGARTNLNAADQATTISAGTGLSGGGSLAANRTLSIANTAVTAGSYGSASNTLSATVNAQGQLTALAATPIAVANTQVSGLGTMSTQNANSVAITGGSVSGITDLAVADGGTGASDASGARTNLAAAASATTISAGTGLSGGGDLTANRTLSITNTGVTAAAVGSASKTLTATVNAQGQLTVLADTNIAIANTQVSGLGTASVLNAAVALGVATLDAGGTVPLSQIPASIQGGVSYQGSWNASTNTPTLTSSVGSKGYYYVVSVAGSTNLNGITDWLPGDWAIFNGSVWEQIDNTDTVASVNGYVGAVVLNAADVGAPPTTRSISTGTGLTGGGDLSADRTFAIDSTVATLTGTQTLTNKTISLANNTLQATSAEIAAAVTDETGTGALVFATSPTLVTPALGTPASGVVTNLTGTASININGTVGATTPNTGAFTDLSFSGTGTFSGGTANGVAYLNGSKVLTTGSALTFDGTKFYTSGVFLQGDTNNYGGYAFQTGNQNGLAIRNAANSAVIAYFGGGGSSALSAAGNYAVVGGTDGVIFGRGVNEDMRLTSTGLGIGTSSPAVKLEVAATSNAAVVEVLRLSNNGSGANTQAQINFAVNTTSYATVTGGYGASAPQMTFNLPNATAGNFVWQNVSAETMRLDSSGNLGIGTSSPLGKLGVGGAIVAQASAYTASTAGATFGYYSGGAYPITYLQMPPSGGFQLWGSDTAAKLTVDTSGNLGLGVTPSASTLPSIQSTFGILTGNSQANIAVNAYYTDAWRYTSTAVASLYSQISGQHRWSVAPSGTAGDAISFTQAMTLDASGNLGIGTSSPAGKLDVRGNSPSAYIVDTTFSAVQSALYLSVPAATTYAGLVADFANDKLYFRHNSATRMTLDASGNLGIGTSSPAYKLDVVGSGKATNAFAVGDSSGNLSGSMLNESDASKSITFNADPANVGASSFMRWNVDGSEKMRLTATSLYTASGVDVGIGTSSPTTKIDIDNGAAYAYGLTFQVSAQTARKYQLGMATGGVFALYDTAAAAQRLVVDTSGNLGLGVTPSASWNSGYKALQIGLYSTLSYGEGKTNVTTNAYYNGTNWIYGASDIAGMYKQGNTHAWFTAPSGTAGDAITFTQAMTLDASGNLGVGTTSPTQNGGGGSKVLHVNAAGASDWSTIHFTNGTTGTTGSDGFVMGLIASDGNAHLVNYENTAMVFYTNAAERARISSDGTFRVKGAGTAGSTDAFQVAGTAPADAARIDSSGNLLVGTTSAPAVANIESFAFERSGGRVVCNGKNTDTVIDVNQTFDDTDARGAMRFFRNETQVGSISVSTSATAYNTSSDYRLKNITGPITTSGAYIDSLNPVEGTWKADGSTFVGLIAHEIQEASRTNVATGVKDGEQMQGMDYSNAELIANLIAEIQDLRKRLAAAGI